MNLTSITDLLFKAVLQQQQKKKFKVVYVLDICFKENESKTTLFLCLLFCNFRQSTDLSSAAAAEPQTSSTQHHPKNGHRPDWTRFHSLGALHGCVRRPHGAPRALRGRREAARQVCAQLPLIRFCFLFCFCFVITYPL